MDVLDRMLDHDATLVADLLDRAAALPDARLDEPLLYDDVDDERTLRDLLAHLVYSKETWTAAVAGRPAPDAGATSLADLRRRYAAAAPEWLRVARSALAEGRADEAFVDATCDPPQTFTYGGMVAHVLTFSAYRRTLALLALARAGVTDLGLGDPS